MRTYSGLFKTDGPEGTASDLEAKALAEARKFFGPDVELRVRKDYQAGIYGDGKLGAPIVVEEVESAWKQDSLFPDWDDLMTPWWRHL